MSGSENKRLAALETKVATLEAWVKNIAEHLARLVIALNSEREVGDGGANHGD
jgi:hypothetical protein